MKIIEKLLPHNICTHCQQFKPVINELNTVSRISIDGHAECSYSIELSCENLKICKNLITLVRDHHNIGEAN